MKNSSHEAHLNSTALPYPVDVPYTLTSSVFRTFLPMEALDVSGRPLLEGRSLLFPPAENDFTQCPYHGSRNNHSNPMNAAALLNLANHRSETESFFRALSLSVKNNTSSIYDDQPHSRLMRLGYTGFKSPQPWLLSNLLDIIRPLPSEVAITAKLSLGLIDLGFSSIESDIPIGLSASELYNYAEVTGKLIGRDEVCAAPSALIKQFLSIALNSSDDGIASASLALAFDMQDLVDFACLSFSSDAIAILYNYVRLSLIKTRSAPTDTHKHFRVSFPSSMKLYKVIENNISLSESTLSAYVNQPWASLRTKDNLCDIWEVMTPLRLLSSRKPNSIDMSTSEWNDIKLATVDVISSLERAFNTMKILPRSSIHLEVDTLDLFFGNGID